MNKDETSLKLFKSIVYDFKPTYLNVTNNSIVGSDLTLASKLFLQHFENDFNLIELYLHNFNLYYINYDLLSGFKLYSSFIYSSFYETKNEMSKMKDIVYDEFIAFEQKPSKLERLSTLINIRESVRNFAKYNMSFKDLSAILQYAFGVTNLGKRTFSSAGSLYPIDLYFYANNVKGLRNAVYKTTQNGIEVIKSDELFDMDQAAKMDNINYLDSNIFLFFVWNSNISRFKYSNASLGFAFIEVGEIVRNLELVSASLDYGMCSLGGFNKIYIENFLSLDKAYCSYVIHAAIIGKKD